MSKSERDASTQQRANSRSTAANNSNGRDARRNIGNTATKATGYVDIIDRLDLSGLGMSGELVWDDLSVDPSKY